MTMKEAVKTLIKSPAAFVILVLILLLALLFTVRAASDSDRVVNKSANGEPVARTESLEP